MINIASSLNNSYVIDFMIPSNITMNDYNYWDPIHYTIETAEQITKIIGNKLKKEDDIYQQAETLWP